MNTKTKARNKVDLHAMIGPLTQEPEPKTLEECLLEAGGFPFVARTVVPGAPTAEGVRTLPVGTERRFTARHAWEDGSSAFYAPEDDAETLATIPRWFLVGHKT